MRRDGLRSYSGATSDRGDSIDAEEILDRQRERESSARTYALTLPIVPVRAEGMVVTGADGRSYLDCLSGAGALALGHNHPVAVDAVRRLLDTAAPWHMLDVATPFKDEFVEVLFGLLPPALADGAKVHFCSPAGTDAVEAALKLSATATGRRGVLAFTGAYHGMSAASLSVSGLGDVRNSFSGPVAEVTRLPYPYSYRCPFGVGGRAGADLSARYAAGLLADTHSGVLPPAAMILEAVQGEGGVIPAPDGWLRTMRELTVAHGIPLIVDEVQTGAGRTGTMWAFEHAGVVPDVVVLSKAIGGGLPLAVIVYRGDLDVWTSGAHTGTFRGDQLAMAAGAATLRFVAEEGLDRRAGRIGADLMAGLVRVGKERACIGEVRGRGLLIGVEVVDPEAAPDGRGTRPAAPALARRVREECLRNGLIVELAGRAASVVKLLPPLTMTDAEAGMVLDRLAAAVAVAEGAWRPADAPVATRVRWEAPAGSDLAASAGCDGRSVLGPLVARALEALSAGSARRGGPLAALGPVVTGETIRAELGAAVLPEEGHGSVEALAHLVESLGRASVAPDHPHCAGHLHTPPLAVAVAADLVAGTVNPSLDSWDQGPAAVVIEEAVTDALARLVGFHAGAGVMTGGGTESNLMGLLLARERVVRAAAGVSALEAGVPAPLAGRLRVVCSAAAHFSVARGAALLGLGENAVLAVPVDVGHRLRPETLDEALTSCAAAGDAVVAVVATAGTTDLGAIDPLPEIAAVAARHGCWLHVDASYGGGALLSDRLAGLLEGIGEADSVAVDLHKLGWQPVAAGAFLVPSAAAFAPLERSVEYLNPADDVGASYPSLLGRSLRTTRRADSFKVAVTFRALGRRGLGRLVDRCHDLARHAAARVAAHPRLELTAEPVLTTVVFRYVADGCDGAGLDRMNAELRRRLLAGGTAVVGRTSMPGPPAGSAPGRVRLKLTLLNPHTDEQELDRLIEAVVATGDDLAARHQPER